MGEIKLLITSDILDALDPPDPGEVIIYVEQDENGLLMEIETGPDLNVEVVNSGKNGSR